MVYGNALNVQPTVNTAVIGTGSAFSTLAYTTAATASTLAERDSSVNLVSNNFVASYATTATAAGTTTLTVASAQQQDFTGTTTQTVVLPVVTTLPQTGFKFYVRNNSTGNVTVNSSGGNAVQVMASNSWAIFTCISLTGTTAASWEVVYIERGDVSGAITSLAGDSGSATPTSGGVVTVNGGTTGLTTSGSGSTLSLTGTLGLANGGTNASLTASNGGIFYSTASAGAILAGTATANQMLQSGASGAPAWSTATYPATTTANQLVYSSANNTVTGLAAGANGVLVSSNSSVPSWLANGTPGQVLTAQSGAAPAWATPSTGGTTWNTISTNTAASTKNGYFVTATATLTLPSGASLGDYVEVAYTGATGAVTVQAQGTDTIQNGTQISGAAGTAVSSATGDSVKLVYSGSSWVFVGAGQGLWNVT